MTPAGTYEAPESGLGRLVRRLWVPVAILLLAVVGAIDFAAPPELSFSLLYLLPIAAVAWYGDRRFGPLASFISAVVWMVTDLLAGPTYSRPLALVWNAGSRFGFFLIVARLLSNLRTELERVRELTRSDYLTGAVSQRYFYELLQREIDRCSRNKFPFTLAYFDLDNFKMINDAFGHSVGDDALRTIVDRTSGRLRKTDILARVGGDEYAILLPETDASAAQVVLPELLGAIRRDMQAKGWPLTISVGAVTFVSAPATTNQAFKLADEVLYIVKNAGKDSIGYSVYPA